MLELTSDSGISFREQQLTGSQEQLQRGMEHGVCRDREFITSPGTDKVFIEVLVTVVCF